MAQLTLLRKSTVHDASLNAYRMVLEITAAEGMSKYAFVNQRIKDFIKNTFDDQFAAVCTPAQLEDLDMNSPAAGTSYYRTYQIDVQSRNAAYLEEVFQSIVRELQKLVSDYEALNVLQADGLYTITADTIDVNTAIIHTHYRLPLAAAPCGLNELYDGDTKQRVASQNPSLQGWLNDTSEPGFNFKYNIEQDSSLNVLWPPSADKIGYAHLEVNGITATINDVKITSDGIFWKNNNYGFAPWAEDYVNSGDPGNDPPVIVLDFIK